MRWTAIVPLKQGPSRKSRLAGLLSQQERERLSDMMAAHVVKCLDAMPAIERILVLSPADPAWPSAEWRQDEGRGVNAEFAALRASLGERGVLVVHADLPLLEVADIEALIAAAQPGSAIAPDRHGTGTNAIALATDRHFDFSFGPGSYARHVRSGGSAMATVRRTGLTIDIDTPEDLEAARLHGFDSKV